MARKVNGPSWGRAADDAGKAGYKNRTRLSVIKTLEATITPVVQSTFSAMRKRGGEEGAWQRS